jgi:hypothetical protein
MLAFRDAFLTRIDAGLIFFVGHGGSILWLSIPAERTPAGLMGPWPLDEAVEKCIALPRGAPKARIAARGGAC